MRTGSFRLFVLSTNTDFLSGRQSKFSHGHPKEQSLLNNHLTGEIQNIGGGERVTHLSDPNSYDFACKVGQFYDCKLGSRR